MSNPPKPNAPASSGASGGGLFSSTSNIFGSNPSASGGGSGGGIFGNVGVPTTGSSAPSLLGATNNLGEQKPILGSTGVGGGTSTPSLSFGTQSQNASATQGKSLFSLQTSNKANEVPPSSQTATSGALGHAQKSILSGNTSTPVQSGGGNSLFNFSSTTPAGLPPAGSSTNQGQSIFPALGAQKSLFGLQNTPTTMSAPSATAASTTSTMPSPFQLKPASGLGQSSMSKSFFNLTPSAPSGGILSGALNSEQPPSEQKTPAASEGGSKSLFSTNPLASTQAAPNAQTASKFALPSATSDSKSASRPFFGVVSGSAASSQPPSTTISTSTIASQKSLFPPGGATMSAAPSPTPGAAPGTSPFAGFEAMGTAPPTSETLTTAPLGQAGAGIIFPTAKLPEPKQESQPAPPSSTSAVPSLTTIGTAPTTPTTATAAISTAPTTATPAAVSSTSAIPSGTTGTSILNASTAGPVPPAQSRLKNKTMDEIITRWATDLTKYQKEFREQAEKVAEWDRMLVENGNRIQKLYGTTVDAERATQEVERQLASVEGQQEELSSWLDRYEREVDEMMSKQVAPGETLQGPDKERERTYKLAEKLSERLNEIGKDLSSMIEEVNGASANLSQTSKTDEPISQIVRILNSHLSQLQLIDQGTAELQAKVDTAQKAGQALGSRISGYAYGSGGISMGSSAADDFYRSYMGRR